ncbi:hypothetical protein [uncultured Sneathiella sp.]|jgi:hypothetical protein|tara:strand:- start:16665 stop:16814 length:150 start_codon:yes stop_codon:yes gene_type:complete
MNKWLKHKTRWVIVGVVAIFGALTLQYATAQSGGSEINLNSPVSFPVDI